MVLVKFFLVSEVNVIFGVSEREIVVKWSRRRLEKPGGVVVGPSQEAMNASSGGRIGRVEKNDEVVFRYGDVGLGRRRRRRGGPCGVAGFGRVGLVASVVVFFVLLFSSALRLHVARFLAIKALSTFRSVFFGLGKEGVRVAAELRYAAMFFCDNLVCNPLAAEAGKLGAR
jgi:hypothetical protein